MNLYFHFPCSSVACTETTSTSHVPQWRAQKQLYLHTLTENVSNPPSVGAHYETYLSKKSFKIAFHAIPGCIWWYKVVQI